MNGSSALERGIEKLHKNFSAYALPFFTCLAVGFLAYFFVFTNKLLNLDEIAGLFKKGESITSGRWALWLSSYIFPDISMPWFNGVVSLLLLSAAVCMVIAVFEIKSPVMQVLLSALMIAFPSQAVTFSYMFTCAPYALALMLAALSVFAFVRGGKRRWWMSAVPMAFSLGIYQAYLSFAAVLYLVYIIKMLLDGEDEKLALRRGFECIAALLMALILYALVNFLVMRLSGAKYNSYADASMQKDLHSILFGLRVAYTAFIGYFTKGYYHLAATPFSQLVHIVCALVVGVELLLFIWRGIKGKRAWLLLLCLALVPLAVNCLYVVSSLRHSLMLYSFTGVYVLAAVCAEKLMDGRQIFMKDLLCVCMTLIIGCNVVYANKLYLKMKLEYENAYSFYQGLVTRIKSAEGFDSDSMVVITGDAENLLYESREIDTSDLVGIMEGLINVYSRNDFITYYIGFTPEPVNWEAWKTSGGAELIESMPEYPYEGCVQKAGDYLIVKLG